MLRLEKSTALCESYKSWKTLSKNNENVKAFIEAVIGAMQNPKLRGFYDISELIHTKFNGYYFMDYPNGNIIGFVNIVIPFILDEKNKAQAQNISRHPAHLLQPNVIAGSCVKIATLANVQKLLDITKTRSADQYKENMSKSHDYTATSLSTNIHNNLSIFSRTACFPDSPQNKNHALNKI